MENKENKIKEMSCVTCKYFVACEPSIMGICSLYEEEREKDGDRERS